ncbi:MAG TPA: hypothetical protein VJ486_01815 [Geothrix sp.]|nr:hypothetical protein [Geothrix sp.]
MLPFMMSEAASLVRMIRAVSVALLWVVFSPGVVHGAEPRIVALHGFDAAEVRQEGFTLPQAMKVHVYARGGAVRTLGRQMNDTPFFAYGWILNADTREVVWQMDGLNSKRDWEYRIADQYLTLPQGRYEAYFSNHGFGQSLLFAQWTRNIDRREASPRDTQHARGFLAALGADDSSLLRHWREQVGNYGMEIYLPSGGESQVQLFEAPQAWKNRMITLAANRDGGQWSQAFRLKRAATVHVYAEGEGSGSRMHDFGWILDAHSRKRVWEMTADKSAFAGGARKNRRQVETLELPAGDYEAHFITDDSHSPADWNAAPPCDPGMYGLTVSLPKDGDLASFSTMDPLSWTVLAEVVRVTNDQDRKQTLTLSADRQVRVLALGESDGDEMADDAWIENASGKRVWSMDPRHSLHAGGASKNRMADEIITLPKGTYTLRVRTDDSHAYGDWNSAAPWDAEHYGITLFAAKP